MRKNSSMRMLMLGAALSAALAAGGCSGQQYEKVETAAEAGTSEAGGAGVRTADGAAGGQTADGGARTGQPGAGDAAGQDQPEAAAGQEDSREAAGASDTGRKNPEAESSALRIDTTQAAVISMADRDETVYVNATDVNIRTAPQPGSNVVTKLSTGAELKRTGYQEEWSRVIYEGKECYIASRYVTTEKPEAAVFAPVEQTASKVQSGTAQEVGLNPDWKYAGYAKITSGKALLYRADDSIRKGKVVCVNAGHGTQGGSSVKTQCHPDGTPKVTGGTTGAGATSAAAVSGGMQFNDGTAEAKVTLAMALKLKEKLLARGYDVLMIRESDDVQLDNVARTVIANNMADCHIALHWDSTGNDKGAFYMSVPNVASYRAMEPVASHWQQHHALGDSLIAGLQGAGVKIFSSGKMEMDLTQTSYSTVASVDIELGDKASDHSSAALDTLAKGLADGVDQFFGQQS